MRRKRWEVPWANRYAEQKNVCVRGGGWGYKDTAEPSIPPVSYRYQDFFHNKDLANRKAGVHMQSKTIS